MMAYSVTSSIRTFALVLLQASVRLMAGRKDSVLERTWCRVGVAKCWNGIMSGRTKGQLGTGWRIGKEDPDATQSQSLGSTSGWTVERADVPRDVDVGVEWDEILV
jgi:hypothetical protein